MHDYLANVCHREPREAVRLRRLPRGAPPSPVAPTSGPHLQMLRRAVLETLGEGLQGRIM